MATEVAQFKAEQAAYELTHWARKAELQSAKLTKEVAVEVQKRKRVEESMEDGKRELERQQRLSSKHERQLQIDREALEHQQFLCLSMTDRLAHEQKVTREEREKLKKTFSAVKKGRQAEKQVSTTILGH
jgi:hypothetical protein